MISIHYIDSNQRGNLVIFIQDMDINSSSTNISFQIYHLDSWKKSHDIIISTQLISLHLPLVLLLVVLIVKLKGSATAKKHAPLPPGPTPWPLIGNLPEIWLNKPSFKWILGIMKQLDTGIACIRLANTHVIAVTSPEIAREFLKKHDSVFASRPITMATKYASRGFLSTALVPSGDQWKKMRKVLACNIINPAKLSWLLHKRTQEADNLVRFIYNQCINNENHGSAVINLRVATRHYTGNVIRRMMFNRRYFGEGKKDGGPGIEEERHVESVFTVLMHLNTFILSDYVPWLRPLDLEGHEKIVSEAVRIVNEYHDPIIDERVEEWRQGKKTESEDMLDAFILAKDSNGKPALSVEEIKAQCIVRYYVYVHKVTDYFSVEEIKAQCMEIVIATVDNPANATEWAMAEMLNKPEILQKATEEIDNIVGKNKLVQETDIPKLNYVKSCAREALRLHPVSPFIIPHVSNADATVAGYFIPKGSHVIIARRGVDPKYWDEPWEFKPERHLKDVRENVELVENELRFVSFGTGRRGCIGVGLGSAMTIMLLARLIHSFTWEVPPNESKIDLSESGDNLFLAKPLHALAKPRLPAALYTQFYN